VVRERQQVGVPCVQPVQVVGDCDSLLRRLTDKRVYVVLLACRGPTQHTHQYGGVLLHLRRQVNAVFVESDVEVVDGGTEVVTERFKRGAVLVTSSTNHCQPATQSRRGANTRTLTCKPVSTDVIN